MSTDRQPDWKISELYKSSWELVKKHKVLWVFGMAVAFLATGGNLGSSSNSRFNSSDWQNLQKIFQNHAATTAALPTHVGNVLGTSTTALTQLTQQITANIPVYFYFILGVEVFLAIVAAIIINIVTQAWSNGALINSIEIGLQKSTPSIKNSSEQVFPVLKSLVWLVFVPGLILGISLAVALGIIFAASLFASGTLNIILIILGVIVIGAFLYWLIMLVMAQIWALREVVIDKKSGQVALFAGFKIVRKKFWSMLLLGLANLILALVAIGLPATLIIGLVIGMVSLTAHQLTLTPVFIPLIIILVLALITGFIILTGIITAFKATVWTIAYHKIRGKYDSH
ncbi:hypothetical protein M1563_03735 [Patescibacteria group bacterium]|nr:hypothetical protein [Patescibacteria group bacterium]MCL5410044.1 hypothetical protein [Patescibacteria group bacterium]